VYPPRAWKKLLWLATAFTVGHSVTLVLTALGYRFLEGELVETLIPVTIILTAGYNLWMYRPDPPVRAGNYLLAVGFGLIHGMGCAGFFTEMLSGMRDDIVGPLLWFNVGLEVGQLLIVGAFMALTAAALRWGKLAPRYWAFGVTVAGGLVAAYLLVVGLLPEA